MIGRRVAARARASESVKRAVRHGVDIIYHCDFADDEALDLVEARQGSRLSPGRRSASCWRAWKGCAATTRASGRIVLDRLQRALRRELPHAQSPCASAASASCWAATTDFAANPQGTNARDLEHFVIALRVHGQRGAAGGHAHRRRDHGSAGTSSAWSSRATSPTSLLVRRRSAARRPRRCAGQPGASPSS